MKTDKHTKFNKSITKDAFNKNGFQLDLISQRFKILANPNQGVILYYYIRQYLNNDYFQ